MLPQFKETISIIIYTVYVFEHNIEPGTEQLLKEDRVGEGLKADEVDFIFN